MLVITRKPYESFNLHTSDGVIQVCITGVVGKQIKVGITAPEAVSVARSEIDDRVEQPGKVSIR